MDNTRVAVIGLGGIAQLVHLPILSKLKNVTIEAVTEVNKNRLVTVADKFKIKKRFSDYKEMLEKTEIDAVIIATPTNTHNEIAIDCLKAKKDILIEKPIALNYEETKKIDDAVKKNKCKAMVGMNSRFRPDAMLLKSLINSKELGELFYIRCGWTRKQSSDQRWFKRKTEAGGGVIFDLGIVLLDLGLWFLDYAPVKSISVQNYFHQTKTVEDSAVGFLRFKNSAVLNFEVSWSFHSERDSFNLITFCTQGTGHLNPLRAYKRIKSTRLDYTPAATSESRNLYRKSYENELKYFIGAVRGVNPIMSSSEEALLRMKLLEGIYQSARQNSEVVFK